MDERFLSIIALVTAIAGLVLLIMTAPSTDTGFRLQGIVVAAKGTHVTVVTNVTLIARGLHRGSAVDLPVFWDGESFVAVPQR